MVLTKMVGKCYQLSEMHKDTGKVQKVFDFEQKKVIHALVRAVKKPLA